MADINIEANKLGTEIGKIDAAIEQLEPYDSGFISDSVACLGKMKSDFTGKLKDTLDNMQDTTSPELIKEMKRYSSMLAQTKAAFENTDDNVAGGLAGNK